MEEETTTTTRVLENTEIVGLTPTPAKVGEKKLEAGDMVWGKVKSHPWWPGHIFNDAFVSSSVRRTRAPGNVLVAFFGDSSYGWFDPSELIPFEEYYEEKIKQTSGKPFVKAVEEAVGEAGRRSALGLACKCRNEGNFRNTRVEGFTSVDVSGYEAGGIYSEKQIAVARGRFSPREAVEFVRELGVMPMEYGKGSLEFWKNKAVLMAYRKATFEEFDETYAQAFGMQQDYVSEELAGRSKKQSKEKPRALFSGPLVIAEALSDKKSSKKQVKVKDKSKNDKYLFKRRDEPSNPFYTNQEHLDSAPSSWEGVPTMTSKDYVLQKRALTSETSESEDRTPTHVGPVQGTESVGLGFSESGHNVNGRMKSGITNTSLADGFEEYIQREGKEKEIAEQDTFTDVLEGEVDNVMGGSFSTNISEPLMEYSLPKDGVVKKVQKDRPVKNAKKDGSVAKIKVPKQRKEDLNSEKSVKGKKKKKKRDSGSPESIQDHPNKRLKTANVEELMRKSAGKSVEIGGFSKESQSNIEKNENAASASHLISYSPSVSSVELENVELSQLVEDLLALACDPFHGADRNSAAIVRHVFLRYRSLVFAKSLVTTPSEAETPEISVGKAPLHVEDSRGSSSKPTKQLTRPDDPTRSGRKRGPSDRQEEKSVQRIKKVNEIKSMAAEKKKIVDEQPPEPKKVNQQSFFKKPEPVKVVDYPAMLVMKFPTRVTLPSTQELKARLGRFGPIDHDATRAYWKSSTCRVVFKHISDARAAYQHAIRTDNLFGNMKVNYQVKEVGVSEPSESTNCVEARAMSKSSSLQQQLHQQSGQLKSILKKPSGEEPKPVARSARETPRVKFMLGGVKSVSNNNMEFNNGGSSSLAMDVNNSMNIRKVIPSSSLPALLPLPPGIYLDPRTHGTGQSSSSNSSKLNTQYNEMVLEPRKSSNFNNATTTVMTPVVTAAAITANTTITTHVDISHKMLSLLIKCNDIVNDVQGSLGYAAYQPLK